MNAQYSIERRKFFKTGVLFVTASFGHIYMGALGSESGFEGMWRGRVDAAWAKQHADLWYKDVAEKDGKKEADNKL